MNLPDLDSETIDRIIEMAWEDRTPFEAIEQQFGLQEKQTYGQREEVYFASIDFRCGIASIYRKVPGVKNTDAQGEERSLFGHANDIYSNKLQTSAFV